MPNKAIVTIGMRRSPEIHKNDTKKSYDRDKIKWIEEAITPDELKAQAQELVDRLCRNRRIDSSQVFVRMTFRTIDNGKNVDPSHGIRRKVIVYTEPLSSVFI